MKSESGRRHFSIRTTYTTPPLGLRAPKAKLILLPVVFQLIQTAVQPFDLKRSVGCQTRPTDVAVVLRALLHDVPVVADLLASAAVDVVVAVVAVATVVVAARDLPAPFAASRSRRDSMSRRLHISVHPPPRTHLISTPPPQQQLPSWTNFVVGWPGAAEFRCDDVEKTSVDLRQRQLHSTESETARLQRLIWLLYVSVLHLMRPT